MGFNVKFYAVIVFILLISPALAREEPLSPSGINLSDNNITENEIEIAENEFSNPGLLPDNPFYFLKRIKEKVQLFLTFGGEQKAKMHLEFAKTRLAEAKRLNEKNKTDEVKTAIDGFNEELEDFESSVKGIGRNVSALVKESADVLEKSRIVLELVLEKVPDQARPAIERALNNSIEKKVRIEIKAENETSEEKIEIRIKETIKKEIERGDEIRERIKEKLEKKIEEKEKEEKPGICIQVITHARNPETNECREFSTPCDVPEGWENVGSCGELSSEKKPNEIPIV